MSRETSYSCGLDRGVASRRGPRFQPMHVTSHSSTAPDVSGGGGVNEDIKLSNIGTMMLAEPLFNGQYIIFSNGQYIIFLALCCLAAYP